MNMLWDLLLAHAAPPREAAPPRKGDRHRPSTAGASPLYAASLRRLNAALLLVMLSGCGKGVAPQPERSATNAAPIKAKAYPLVGEVLKINPAEGKITVRHEAIPAYDMPAMTMTLNVAVKEKAALDDLRIGDKITATLRVAGDHSELDDLNVTEAATPKLTLDLSGATPTLREKTPKLEPGGVVPDFAVTTQEGATLRLAELRGKVVVLTFIYTGCPLPDFCPKMDSKFAELSRLAGSTAARADKVRLLSISFDPEHDTPQVLARHGKLKGSKPPLWQFAVASHEELRKVAEPLGLMYGPMKDEIVHNLSTAVIGPDGKLVVLYAGSSWTPEDVYKVVLTHLPR